MNDSFVLYYLTLSQPPPKKKDKSHSRNPSTDKVLARTHSRSPSLDTARSPTSDKSHSRNPSTGTASLQPRVPSGSAPQKHLSSEEMEKVRQQVWNRIQLT